MKLLTTDLERIPWLRHGFFTRTGGVSTGLYESLNCGIKTDDAPQNIAANRARAAQMLGMASENLVIARQVHGNRALAVEKAWESGNTPEADALVTAKPGLALGVLTADCVPVLFADQKNKVIGAAHAGWRGALGGILESTIDAMRSLGADTASIQVAIGPCIRAHSYEVQEDFRDAFLAQSAINEKFFQKSLKAGKFLFDLAGYASMRLRAAGIETIYDTKRDTMTDEAAFFSNRRAFIKSEKGFGLQVSVIAIHSS